MKKLPYNDEYGEELTSQHEETFHPVANIETFTDGLTAEQRSLMSPEEIYDHHAKLGFEHGFRMFGWFLFHDLPKHLLALTVFFRPEISLTGRCKWLNKGADAVKKSCGSKQNVQQLFKGMRDCPTHGHLWEGILTTESGEVKPKKEYRLQGVMTNGSKHIHDDQIGMFEE